MILKNFHKVTILYFQHILYFLYPSYNYKLLQKHALESSAMPFKQAKHYALGRDNNRVKI